MKNFTNEITKTTIRPTGGWAIAQRSVASNMTSTEFMVYFILLTYKGDKEYCYPTIKTLCKDTGLQKTAIKDATRGLQSKGWIYKEKQFNSSNKYYVFYAEEI